MQTLILALSLLAHSQAAIAPGRFQLLQLGTMRRDQYLLDSQTGKLWARVCMKWGTQEAAECSYSAWLLEEVEGVTATLTEIRKAAQ
jgi:hypothetical protein